MNLDDLTLGEVKALINMTRQAALTTHFSVGEKYLIRTVTMMYTGELISISDSDLLLANAAWIADSGRYTDALERGELNEVEPYPNQVIVSRAAIVDAAIWAHALPRKQK